MSKSILIPISELLPGYQLGQDIMVGSQVLLRKGTLLTQAQVDRLANLNLRNVTVDFPDDAPQVEAPAKPPRVEIPQPDFRSLTADSDVPSWMAQPSFNTPVKVSHELAEIEKNFATNKSVLRQKAGLRPIIDPAKEKELMKSINVALTTTGIQSQIPLKRLDELSEQLDAALEGSEDAYIEFMDIGKYGDYLGGLLLMSAKVCAAMGCVDLVDKNRDVLLAQMAIQSMFVLLPANLARPLEMLSQDEKLQIAASLAEFAEWLKSSGYADDRVIDLVLMSFERFNGQGVPLGLAKDEIPEQSQMLGMSRAYSDMLISSVDRDRTLPRNAADELIRQSDNAFESSRVNQFLRIIGFYPNGSLVELSNGSHAIVVRQNQIALLKPVVRILLPNGEMAEELDLQNETQTFIRTQILEF